MNKYTPSQRVARHAIMSDEERDCANREFIAALTLAGAYPTGSTRVTEYARRRIASHAREVEA